MFIDAQKKCVEFFLKMGFREFSHRQTTKSLKHIEATCYNDRLLVPQASIIIQLSQNVNAT